MTATRSPLNSRGYIARCTHGLRNIGYKRTLKESPIRYGGTPSECFHFVRRRFRRSCRPTAIERRRLHRLSTTLSPSYSGVTGVGSGSGSGVGSGVGVSPPSCSSSSDDPPLIACLRIYSMFLFSARMSTANRSGSASTTA